MSWSFQVRYQLESNYITFRILWLYWYRENTTIIEFTFMIVLVNNHIQKLHSIIEIGLSFFRLYTFMNMLPCNSNWKHELSATCFCSGASLVPFSAKMYFLSRKIRYSKVGSRNKRMHAENTYTWSQFFCVCFCLRYSCKHYERVSYQRSHFRRRKNFEIGFICNNAYKRGSTPCNIKSWQNIEAVWIMFKWKKVYRSKVWQV
jgi:hypothetical protein